MAIVATGGQLGSLEVAFWHLGFGVWLWLWLWPWYWLWIWLLDLALASAFWVLVSTTVAKAMALFEVGSSKGCQTTYVLAAHHNATAIRICDEWTPQHLTPFGDGVLPHSQRFTLRVYCSWNFFSSEYFSCIFFRSVPTLLVVFVSIFFTVFSRWSQRPSANSTGTPQQAKNLLGWTKMPRRKKKFIDKKNARTYHVVSGEHSNILESQPEDIEVEEYVSFTFCELLVWSCHDQFLYVDSPVWSLQSLKFILLMAS